MIGSHFQNLTVASFCHRREALSTSYPIPQQDFGFVLFEVSHHLLLDDFKISTPTGMMIMNHN